MATVNIFVSLDITANPPVQLVDQAGNSARSKQASSGDTIRWQKRDNNDSFDITALEPTGNGTAFSTPTTAPGGQWLSCTFQPPSPDTEYPYTLTVTTSDGNQYTTTDTSKKRDEDRPVIRN